MRSSQSLLVFFACVTVASSSLVVKEPLSGKTGAEKLLVIINGAYVANTNYEEVGVAIQKASDMKLWIAIPSFVLNCPNPGEIGSKIKDAVSTVKSKGFSGMVTTSDVLIGGHSLGGIFSQQVVAGGDYAGLILFGSYLTSTFGYSLASFKYPVLTLAGELDGLTRITRIGTEWKAMKQRIASDGQSAQYKFPVFALPGQSHSQFCSNVNVTSFGTKDLRPEVTWEAAHSAIGEAVTNFMTLVWDSTNAAAKAYIDAKMSYTGGLLSGWLEAQAIEAAWCESAQVMNAPDVTGSFQTNSSSCSNFASFDLTYPTVKASTREVMVVSEVQHHINPTDSSLTDVAATEVDCKILTEKALISAFGGNATSDTDVCVKANQMALSKAYGLLPAASLARYRNQGKPFVAKNDEVYSTIVTWQAGTFGFSSDSSSLKVQSPRLITGDEVLCKLLSPSRVVEYMMVDGLPRFDGTVI